MSIRLSDCKVGDVLVHPMDDTISLEVTDKTGEVICIKTEQPNGEIGRGLKHSDNGLVIFWEVTEFFMAAQ